MFRALHGDGWRFVFFSDGREWYRQGDEPVEHLGARRLRGWWVGRTRLVPGLVPELLRTPSDVVVKCVNGKVALPLTYAVARLQGRAFVLWTDIWDEPGGVLHRLGRPLVHTLYRRSDAVLASGSHVSALLRSVGVESSRIVEVQHAVDNVRFGRDVGEGARAGARRRMGVDADAFLVLFVGRLVPEKGLAVLVDALPPLAERHPEVVLAVVGDGPEASTLAERAHARGVAGRIRLVGRLPNDELPAVYQAADVVAVPSLPAAAGSEPWAVVVNEAMAAGVVVVASDAVGAARGGLVRNGITGLVVPAGDAGALSRALDLLVQEPEWRAALGGAGQVAVASVSHQAMVEQFERAVTVAASRQVPLETTPERSRFAPIRRGRPG